MANSFSPAGTSLNLGAGGLMGGASVASQVSSETEEQRRKRLAAMQASRTLPGSTTGIASGYSQALSPAAASLGLGGL
jgi:hypothetical protein